MALAMMFNGKEMKTTLYVIAIFLLASGAVRSCYLYYAVYFDTLLTPRQKFQIYWPSVSLWLAGYLFLAWGKYIKVKV